MVIIGSPAAAEIPFFNLFGLWPVTSYLYASASAVCSSLVLRCFDRSQHTPLFGSVAILSVVFDAAFDTRIQDFRIFLKFCSRLKIPISRKIIIVNRIKQASTHLTDQFLAILIKQNLQNILGVHIRSDILTTHPLHLQQTIVLELSQEILLDVHMASPSTD